MWETVYRHSGSLSHSKRAGGRQCTDTEDLFLKVRGEVGTKCTDTQDLSLKVRWEVGTQYTHTMDLYLKVRGEVGDLVQILSTSI